MATDNQTIARPYAKAAFEFARDKQQLSEWSRTLNFAAQICANPEVATLLHNPEVGQEKVSEWLLGLKPEWFTAELGNFIKILQDNKRLPVLVEISALFDIYRNEHEKRIDVEVRSAMSLSQQQMTQLADVLKKRLQREVRLQSVLDPSIIGGVLIQAGDLVIDGSVRGQLRKLNEELAA